MRNNTTLKSISKFLLSTSNDNIILTLGLDFLSKNTHSLLENLFSYLSKKSSFTEKQLLTLQTNYLLPLAKQYAFYQEYAYVLTNIPSNNKHKLAHLKKVKKRYAAFLSLYNKDEYELGFAVNLNDFVYTPLSSTDAMNILAKSPLEPSTLNDNIDFLPPNILLEIHLFAVAKLFSIVNMQILSLLLPEFKWKNKYNIVCLALENLYTPSKKGGNTLKKNRRFAFFSIIFSFNIRNRYHTSVYDYNKAKLVKKHPYL